MSLVHAWDINVKYSSVRLHVGIEFYCIRRFPNNQVFCKNKLENNYKKTCKKYSKRAEIWTPISCVSWT